MTVNTRFDAYAITVLLENDLGVGPVLVRALLGRLHLYLSLGPAQDGDGARRIIQVQRGAASD